MKSMRCVGLTLVCAAALVSPAVGQEAWVGRKFMPKKGCVMKVGNREFTTFEVPFTVRKLAGEWLWTGQGWVQKSGVVAFDNAASYYTEYLRNHPASAWAYRHRGVFWEQKGEMVNAIRDYTEAIRLDPYDAVAYNNRGYARATNGEHDDAVADLTESIRLNPQFVIAYNNRGFARAKTGEYDKAISDWTEAIRLDPRYARAYSNRGWAWAKKGEYEIAIADYNEGFRLDASNADAYADAAWLRATCPDSRYRDGKRALALARKACELSRWKDGNSIGTLAAAYAESGDFDQAIRWETKAMEMRANDAEYVKGARERLAHYRERKAYREK